MAGELDQLFGVNGAVVDWAVRGTDKTSAVAITGNDIVAAGLTAGDIFLVRWDMDGRRDDSFGTVGNFRYSFPPLAGMVALPRLALAPDGGLVVATLADMISRREVVLLRVDLSGRHDEKFGSGGVVLTNVFPPGDPDPRVDITIQQDGDIIAASSAFSERGEGFGIARYHPDGARDVTFGVLGVVSIAGMGGQVCARSVVLQPDGKIVVAGSIGEADPGDIALARCHPDGQLDTSFADDGRAVFPAIGGVGDHVNALVMQPDGKLVVGGWSDGLDPGSGESRRNFALLCCNADGSRDRSFGADGVVTTSIGRHAEIHGLALQPDGSIVACGFGESGAALARYTANGALDVGFGQGGAGLLDLSRMRVASAVAIQPDGDIVVAGRTGRFLGDRSVAVARVKGS